jgi:hypothetical protein
LGSQQSSIGPEAHFPIGPRKPASPFYINSRRPPLKPYLPPPFTFRTTAASCAPADPPAASCVPADSPVASTSLPPPSLPPLWPPPHVPPFLSLHSQKLTPPSLSSAQPRCPLLPSPHPSPRGEEQRLGEVRWRRIRPHARLDDPAARHGPDTVRPRPGGLLPTQRGGGGSGPRASGSSLLLARHGSGGAARHDADQVVEVVRLPRRRGLAEVERPSPLSLFTCAAAGTGQWWLCCAVADDGGGVAALQVAAAGGGGGGLGGGGGQDGRPVGR